MRGKRRYYMARAVGLCLLWAWAFLPGAGELSAETGGTIVAWGNNSWGQCDVPAPNNNFVAIAAGYAHSLGLKSDGSIVGWGFNGSDRCTTPAPNTSFVAVASGSDHSLGIKANGSIVTWWSNPPAIPEPNSDFVAIEAGYYHALGRKSNGAVVAWGTNWYNQFSIPEPNVGYQAVAAGYYHSLGLKPASASGIEEIEGGGLPVAGFTILALVPNPFNPTTDISFATRESGPVALDVFDLTGRRIRTDSLGLLGSGPHSARWDGRDAQGHDVGSGVYFVRLRSLTEVSPAVKAVLAR